MDIAYGENLHLNISLNAEGADWAKMVFVKAGNKLSVYYNGILAGRGAGYLLRALYRYYNTGAEMTESFTIFRQSAVKINRFQIYNEALEPEEALAW